MNYKDFKSKYGHVEESSHTIDRQTLPLISIYGAQLPEDSYIASVYDTIGTSYGWRNVANIQNIVRVNFFLDGAAGLAKNEMLGAIIVGYLAMRRIITWKIVIGDICNFDKAAEQMYGVLIKPEHGERGENKEIYHKTLMMLEHIDKVCSLFDCQIRLKDVFDSEVDTSLTRAKSFVTRSDNIAYRCIYKAISIVLSDQKGTCRLCMDRREDHKSMTIVINTIDNALISMGCRSDDKDFNQYMEKNKCNANFNEGATPLQVSSENIRERMDSILAKLRAGTLNQYVTGHNTCYLTGQQGKIIMPIIVDTFVLRLCGIESYLGEDRQLMIVSKWSNEGRILQRPTHILVGEVKLNRVVHLIEQTVHDVRVVRNVGRHLIAGVTNEVISGKDDIN